MKDGNLTNWCVGRGLYSEVGKDVGREVGREVGKSDSCSFLMRVSMEKLEMLGCLSLVLLELAGWNW